jgi:hypothetical protein
MDGVNDVFATFRYLIITHGRQFHPKAVNTAPNCPKCDYLNPDSAQFCQSCGSSLFVPLPAIPTKQPTPTKRVTYAQKWIIGAILVAVVIAGGAFASLSMNPSRTATRTPPPQPTWHVVADYSGTATAINGSTTTFETRGNQNQLYWQYNTGYPAYSVFAVFIHPYSAVAVLCLQGSSMYPYDPNCLISSNSFNSGNEFLNLAPGNYSLETVAVQGSWRVSVTDYY